MSKERLPLHSQQYKNVLSKRKDGLSHFLRISIWDYFSCPIFIDVFWMHQLTKMISIMILISVNSQITRTWKTLFEVTLFIMGRNWIAIVCKNLTMIQFGYKDVRTILLNLFFIKNPTKMLHLLKTHVTFAMIKL